VIFGIGNVMQYLRGGQIVGLAVDGDRRSPLAPEIPTFRELGYTVHVMAASFGIHAPAGTPKPIVERLHAEAVRVLATAEMKQRLATEGAEPVGSTPAAFAAFIKDEMTRWSAAARTANIRPE
jgi:tripartite-type tricarboxylate transporter receptor subunit TctC